MASPDAAADDDRARVLRFFDEQLPRVIAGRRDLFDQSKGVVTVLVEGAGGWTVTFGDHAAPEAVSASATLEADLVVVWPVPAFLRVLDGQARDVDAVRPLTVGDRKLLGRLGSLLLPPAQGGLGARLWGV